MVELMECLRDGVKAICGLEAATWIYNLKYNMLKPSMMGMQCQTVLGAFISYCILIFTARCYAERGYEIVCRLSVRLYVTFRYRDHIGWNTSNIISRPNT